MTIFHLFSVIIFLTAVFSYLNHRFIKWPQTIGIMAMSLIGSVIMVISGSVSPLLVEFSRLVSTIDFNTLLMKIMLGFLLFAGGFHINAGYYLADLLHVSGPLAMVVAGIITGNKGKAEAMSDTTRDYLSKFWELMDEILNALLFMLIGLEMLIIRINTPIFFIGICMILIVLVARWLSVLFPVLLLRRWFHFEKHAVSILTWGGLRGGISVALALSLPAAFYRDQIVAVTYIIVIFSILVQGMTIGKLAKRLV